MIFPPLLFPFILSTLFSLSTSEITASEALNLAPSLVSQSSALESLLDDYKSIQYALAAIKLKSLLPTQPQSQPEDIFESKEDKDDEHENDSDDSENEPEEIPTSATIISTSYKNIFKMIKDDDLSETVTSLPIESTQDFVLQQETDAQSKIQEAIQIIHTLQTTLNLAPTANLAAPITATLLAIISAKLEDLADCLEDAKEKQDQLATAKPSKQAKIAAKLAATQRKIFKITHKLVGLISQ